MEKEEIYCIIANNITLLRKREGMTQLELAELLHYSDKTVSKWERGEASPDIETLFLLADIFKVTINDLVYPFEEKKAPVAKEQYIFTWNHFFITLIAMCIPCLITAIGMFVIGFIDSLLYSKIYLSMIMGGLSAAFIVWLVFATLWWPSLWQQISCSFLVWSLAILINLLMKNSLIFIIAGVLQVSILFWWFLKRSYGLNREKWRLFPKKTKK